MKKTIYQWVYLLTALVLTVSLLLGLYKATIGLCFVQIILSAFYIVERLKPNEYDSVEICTCSNFSIDELNEQIAEKLKDGWELHGELKVTENLNRLWYVQPLIKYS